LLYFVHLVTREVVGVFVRFSCAASLNLKVQISSECSLEERHDARISFQA
jgi:hypothetical protein